MKKVIKLGSLLIIISLALTPTSSNAFNPLAHIYIADNVCPNCSPKIDYYYGSISPDIALYVANPINWLSRFNDTHVEYIDLRDFAWGSTQMAFAKGWLTHGQNPDTPGADYFAHIAYSHSPLSPPGYVIEKAGALVEIIWPGSEDEQHFEFAHYIIEAIIDLLLTDDDPTLPGKLFFANLFRSWQDRNLLMKVFVWGEGKTDWLTLATAEFTFRQLVNRYAIALMLHNPEEALAQLGAELAEEMFGLVGITPEMLLDDILPEAIYLCEDDYYDVIEEAIDEIRNP